MNEERYYRESGTITPVGVGGALLAGLASGALGGLVYGAVDQVNPLIYVNFIVLFLAAAGVGFATGQAAKVGKLRNSKLVAVLGALAGLVALYAAWVGWLLAVTWRHAEAGAMWVLAPGDLWGWIQILNEKGAWNIRGFTPTGWLLGSVWAIEAAGLVGGAAMFAWSQVGETPFCESCQRWAEEDTVAELEAAPDVDELRRSLELGDYASFRALAPSPVDAVDSLRARIQRCGREGCADYLVLDSVTRKTDKDGKVEESTSRVVMNLRVPPEIRAFLTLGGSTGGAPDTGEAGRDEETGA